MSGIVGHGIDLVETRRIADLLDRHGERFLARVYTPHELDTALPHRRRVEHLAGLFAAKEAVSKALGTGITGFHWTDLEIVHRPSGQPTIHLHGQAAAVASSHGIASWCLSITHTRDLAVASAIACSA